jgi:hypothetical protein
MTNEIIMHQNARFPLGSLDHGERTLVDKAVDLFGFSIPLLEFHEVQSRCPNVSSFMENTTYGHIPHDPTTSQTKERDGNDDDDEDEDDDTGIDGIIMHDFTVLTGPTLMHYLF